VNAARAVAEWHDVDRATFERDIVPRHEPALLRGLVAHWPAVHKARESDTALAGWLAGLDSGGEVDALMLAPEHRGRIGYSADGREFNFLRNRLPLSRVIEQVLRYARFERAPAVAVQSAAVAQCVPGLLADHVLPLLPPDVAPRLWFGNAIRTPAHFDESSNIACVAAGQRRFTLFPPEQVADLYVGPLGHSPTGTPISLVDIEAPDLARHPRFARALAAARVAELEPGDAIYIPPLWWHHVASRGPLNLLINYWWKTVPWSGGLDLLLHALLALKDLPPPQRRAWRALLDHWVFESDARTAEHIWPEVRGVHEPLTVARAAALRDLLRQQLDR
jgi:hypothetical protein